MIKATKHLSEDQMRTLCGVEITGSSPLFHATYNTADGLSGVYCTLDPTIITTGRLEWQRMCPRCKLIIELALPYE